MSVKWLHGGHSVSNRHVLRAACRCRALDADSRNFHAWSYRQFLVRRAGWPLAQELQYSEDKVGLGLGWVRVGLG
jgi:hypothetical protein